MNWKEEALEKLQRYPMMTLALRTIPLELERLTREARELQSVGQGIGSRNRENRAQENRMMNNLVRRQELELQLEQARLWVSVTEEGLSHLTEEERSLLEKLYIQQIQATDLCQELGVERSSLYRYRDAALKKLTLGLYGGLES